MPIDLKTKLSAYWSLDSVLTDSQGTHNLSQTGTVGNATGHVYDTAASFEGTSGNYLTIANTPALSMGDVDHTVAAWVYLTDKSVARPFVAKWMSGSGNQDYLLDWHNTFGFRFVTLNQSAVGFQAVDNGINPSLSTWYHLCGWYDATARTVNLQVNDRTPVSVTFTGTKVTTTAATMVGYQQISGNYMHGRIGPVAIWRGRVLTADDRAYLYNDGAGRPYSEYIEAGSSRRVLSSPHLIGSLG